jgi:hypothetical protein
MKYKLSWPWESINNCYTRSSNIEMNLRTSHVRNELEKVRFRQ